MFAVSDERKPLVMLISLVVIAGALFIILRHRTRPTTPIEVNAAVQRGLGSMAAHEIAKLIDNQGAIAVIELTATEEQLPPAARMQAEFKSVLKSHKNISIVETLTIDPTEVMADGAFGIPAKMYSELIKSRRDLAGIVSFAGVPKLSPAQMKQGEDKPPKFVAVYGLGYYGPWAKPLLESGLVQAVIIPNQSPVPDVGDRVRTAEEWCRVFYEVARPETANLYQY